MLGGDGVPCDGLDELCQGADAYVQTVLREDIVKHGAEPALPGDPRLPLERRGRGATPRRSAGVGTLVLTHYIPGMLAAGQEDGVAGDRPAEHFSGPIVLGDDLTDGRALSRRRSDVAREAGASPEEGAPLPLQPASLAATRLQSATTVPEPWSRITVVTCDRPQCGGDRTLRLRLAAKGYLPSASYTARTSFSLRPSTPSCIWFMT